jgi:transposase
MTIVMAFDQHREQITFDALDTATGELHRGRIRAADRLGFRRWLGRWEGEEIEAALEATTGWRFMVEELEAVGAKVHLAEPAETSARRGPKKRAKSDRQDARHLRELLQAGRVPESWIPPTHILELRSKVRLRHTLIDERGTWQQRIRAQLYHHGVPRRRQLLVGDGREWLETLDLPDAARRQISVALRMIDAVDAQLRPLDQELRALARRQPGCRALQAHYGIGEITSLAILAELGDARRFSSSRHAVRYAGLDITVHESTAGGRPGAFRARARRRFAGPLYEAAQVARRPGSPDRSYYEQAADRLGSNRACISVARKLLKRSFHTLRELGEEALAPA